MTEYSILECPICGDSYASHNGECPRCSDDSLIDEPLPLLPRQTIKAKARVGKVNMLSPKQKGNKVLADGHTFDSQGEYRRYLNLILMKHAAAISQLAVHPKWELLPKLILPKHFARRVQSAISYEADFSYFHEGVFIVEDYKASYGKSKRNDAKGITGKPIITEASRLRHKLLCHKLAAIYGNMFLFRIVTDAEEEVGL